MAAFLLGQRGVGEVEFSPWPLYIISVGLTVFVAGYPVLGGRLGADRDSVRLPRTGNLTLTLGLDDGEPSIAFHDDIEGPGGWGLPLRRRWRDTR